jgi:transcriptional regulator with PAS, ATPase and Fis domain
MGELVQNISNEHLKKIFAQLGFVSKSEVLAPVLRQAYRAAFVSDITVLVEGETGTGKQIVARAIHQIDPKRRSFPFITAHCSAISETLADSELFGHQRGSFTGAVRDRTGLFQTAHRGTLFLDDISDLPLTIQPKLLDVIQRGRVRAVGSDREIPINVRIIAASNRALAPLVLKDKFRSDLFHRLNVVHITLPPLRNRPMDLEALVLHFIERHQAVYGPIETIDPELLRFMQSQPFVGNVRELENQVLRMLFSKKCGSALELVDWSTQAPREVEDVPDPLNDAADCLWQVVSQKGLSYATAIKELEKRVIAKALDAGEYTRREVAGRLQTSERNLYHKIRAHHLARPHRVANA